MNSLSFTAAQEEAFWTAITKDLVARLPLPENSGNWTSAHRTMINEAMSEELIPLFTQDRKIMGLCNFDDEVLKNGKIDLNSTIYSIFVEGKYRNRRPATKHRFSFFLTRKPAEEYLALRNIPNHRIGAKHWQREALPITADPDVTHPLESSLRLWLNSLEYHAIVIEYELDRYKEQQDVREFLQRFRLLHEKLIRYFTEEHDIPTGMRIYTDIYKLSQKYFFQKEDGSKSDIFSIWGTFGFFLREESASDRIRKYLRLDDRLQKWIEEMLYREPPDDEKYMHLFSRLVG
ncbi:MAG: hypothetical protein R2824_02160 [Saprospiraceae bacterium]|nr:hypothetical protein [Lewinella sp.]